MCDRLLGGPVTARTQKAEQAVEVLNAVFAPPEHSRAVHSEAQATRVVIAGKLARPCVEALRQCWQHVTSSQPPQSVLVDLTDLTGIDAEGKELLTQMQRQGARRVGPGVMTEALIEEIVGTGLNQHTGRAWDALEGGWPC